MKVLEMTLKLCTSEHALENNLLSLKMTSSYLFSCPGIKYLLPSMVLIYSNCQFTLHLTTQHVLHSAIFPSAGFFFFGPCYPLDIKPHLIKDSGVESLCSQLMDPVLKTS